MDIGDSGRSGTMIGIAFFVIGGRKADMLNISLTAQSPLRKVYIRADFDRHESRGISRRLKV